MTTTEIPDEGLDGEDSLIAESREIAAELLAADFGTGVIDDVAESDVDRYATIITRYLADLATWAQCEAGSQRRRALIEPWRRDTFEAERQRDTAIIERDLAITRAARADVERDQARRERDEARRTVQSVMRDRAERGQAAVIHQISAERDALARALLKMRTKQ